MQEIASGVLGIELSEDHEELVGSEVNEKERVWKR